MRDRIYHHGIRSTDTRTGRIFAGLFLLVIGAFLVAKESGFFFPSWLFSWQMLLIVIGLFIGLKKQFRNPGWIAPIAVGTFFLLDDFFPDLTIRRYFLPFGIIFVGLLLILRSKNHTNWRGRWDNYDPLNNDTSNTQDADINIDRLNESVVFGNIKKNVLSKIFKGGEVSVVFGSAEIDLTKAEIVQNIKLELNSVFGSIRLIVPPHWQVKTESTAVLGSIDDNRPNTTITSEHILTLEGNAVFGGIEIRSY